MFVRPFVNSNNPLARKRKQGQVSMVISPDPQSLVQRRKNWIRDQPRYEKKEDTKSFLRFILFTCYSENSAEVVREILIGEGKEQNRPRLNRRTQKARRRSSGNLFFHGPAVFACPLVRPKREPVITFFQLRRSSIVPIYSLKAFPAVFLVSAVLSCSLFEIMTRKKAII